MSTYYTGRRARRYNARWHSYSERTLAEALAMIDVPALRAISERQKRSPRVLDVACGTGMLLQRLLALVPKIDAYGVDASEDMLAQARIALKGQPQVHLLCVTAGVPYAPGTFDLTTCTNVLHDLLDAEAALSGLRQLLAPGGQLVLEDFARREFPFPWAAFEWMLQRIERARVHAYTLGEARSLCERVGLHVVAGRTFTIDWLWRGWVVHAYRV